MIMTMIVIMINLTIKIAFIKIKDNIKIITNKNKIIKIIINNSMMIMTNRIIIIN